MKQINKKSHYATIISSLNKEYKKLKIGKSINTKDLYLLNIIYNLLQEFYLTLLETEIEALIKIYNTILYNSKVVCNNNCQEPYQINKNNIFIQADETDCNITPPLPLVDKIYYWQEESYLTTFENVKALTYTEGYFTNKLFDTYVNFENIGKTINYEYLGRICFYATESDNKNFIITDLLNNNVTDVFNPS